MEFTSDTEGGGNFMRCWLLTFFHNLGGFSLVISVPGTQEFCNSVFWYKKA